MIAMLQLADAWELIATQAQQLDEDVRSEARLPQQQVFKLPTPNPKPQTLVQKVLAIALSNSSLIWAVLLAYSAGLLGTSVS